MCIISHITTCVFVCVCGYIFFTKTSQPTLCRGALGASTARAAPAETETSCCEVIGCMLAKRVLLVGLCLVCLLVSATISGSQSVLEFLDCCSWLECLVLSTAVNDPAQKYVEQFGVGSGTSVASAAAGPAWAGETLLSCEARGGYRAQSPGGTDGLGAGAWRGGLALLIDAEVGV